MTGHLYQTAPRLTAPVSRHQAQAIVIASAVWFAGFIPWLVFMIVQPFNNGANGAGASVAYLALVMLPAVVVLVYFTLRNYRAEHGSLASWGPFTFYFRNGWRESRALLGTRTTFGLTALGVGFVWMAGAAALAVALA